MGWRWPWQGGTASAELYPDKLIKLAGVVFPLLLGIVALIVVFLVDRVECYGHGMKGRRPEWDGPCWAELFPAAEDAAGMWGRQAHQALHKTWPPLLVGQALALALPLLLWHWCHGRHLAHKVQELLHHVTTLTNQYARYNRGGKPRLEESSLHRDLDTYLEHLAHVLTLHGSRVWRLWVAKWVIVLVIIIVWIIVHVVLMAPDFVIFPDKVACLVMETPPQEVMDCVQRSAMFLRVLWWLTVALLLIQLVVVLYHVIADVCARRAGFTHTFFYRGVPGCQDRRLALCVDAHFDPRHVWLLSRLCTENEALCGNPGLAKALAHKYSYVTAHDRKEQWRDQHYPTIPAAVLDKFRVKAEAFAMGEDERHLDETSGCSPFCFPTSSPEVQSVHVHYESDLAPAARAKPKPRRRNRVNDLQFRKVKGHSHDLDLSSGYASDTSHLHLRHAGETASPQSYGFDPRQGEDYMTPNLYARKIAKETRASDLLEEELEQTLSKNVDRERRQPEVEPHLGLAHNPRRGAARTQDNVVASTPEARGHVVPRDALVRDDTEVDYGAWGMGGRKTAREHAHTSRDGDLVAYGVKMAVRREMAKDAHVWRP